MRHRLFQSRTILVKDGNVDQAFRQLNRILGLEGVFDQYRRNFYFERPCHRRQRENYEICKAIYDEDMARRIQFTLRKNREEPWLGNH